MNKLIAIFSLVFFASTLSFAQTELFRAKLKKEAIPAVVLESITEDFPYAEVTEYAAIPVTIIDEQVYVHMNAEAMDGDYDTYVITVAGKSGAVYATYDREGNLLSTAENLKNVVLPRAIQTSIGRHFPGWGVVGDKMVMTSLRNGKQKTHYKVKLKKGKEHHKVVFDADGNIIRGAEKAKKHRQLKFHKHKMKKRSRDADDDMDKQ